MPFTLKMPKMSPTMEEGTITAWHKKVGEQVQVDELLLEIATDKATVEYNALDAGYIRKIIVAEGGEAKVNQPIAILTETKDESIEGYEPEGLKVEAQPVATPQAATAPAPVPTTPKTTATPAPLPPPQPVQVSTAPSGRVIASPLARKLAARDGLDLGSVKGSGPSGRIMKRDLADAKAVGSSGGCTRRQPTIPAGTYEEESLSPMRKVISQRLQEAKMTIPHFYTTVDIDAGALASLRDQLRTHEIKVSINDLVLKACALALEAHPNVNSGFNAANNTIIRFKTIDISVAVSVKEGLITPIVRHADYKSVQEISQEVRALATKAKEGKLAPHEFQGGSFTISNLGMFGVSQFAAIINPPQAAILAVSSILSKPVVKHGQIVVGEVMSLTLSSDHRVVDGVAAAEFLSTLKKILEAPAICLL